MDAVHVPDDVTSVEPAKVNEIQFMKNPFDSMLSQLY